MPKRGAVHMADAEIICQRKRFVLFLWNRAETCVWCCSIYPTDCWGTSARKRIRLYLYKSIISLLDTRASEAGQPFERAGHFSSPSLFLRLHSPPRVPLQFLSSGREGNSTYEYCASSIKMVNDILQAKPVVLYLWTMLAAIREYLLCQSCH